MKKRLKLILLCSLLLSVLAGCGANASGENAQSTMTIKRNGQIDLALVDVFDKEYYDYTELLNMAKQELETFPGEGVSLKDSHEFLDGSDKVMLQYHFESAAICEAYMSETCFLGTVKEALDGKLLSNVILRAREGDGVISQSELLQMGDQKVLITEINAIIESPWKVAYFTEGVLVEEKDVFNTTAAEGISVIVFE